MVKIRPLFLSPLRLVRELFSFLFALLAPFLPFHFSVSDGKSRTETAKERRGTPNGGKVERCSVIYQLPNRSVETFALSLSLSLSPSYCYTYMY